MSAIRLPCRAMSPIDPALRIRSVALAVSDLPRSADFYERVLGLPLIGETSTRRSWASIQAVRRWC